MTPSNEGRNVPDGTVYAARTERWTSAVGGFPMVIPVGAGAALPTVVEPYDDPAVLPCSAAAGAAALVVAALEQAASTPAVAKSPKPVATWRVRIDDLPCRLVSEVRRNAAVAGSRMPESRSRVRLGSPSHPFRARPAAVSTARIGYQNAPSLPGDPRRCVGGQIG